jgi:hypothetical protein
MLPQLAQGSGNTFWVIPSEVTSALKAVTSAFSGAGETGAPAERGTSARADETASAKREVDAALRAALEAAQTATATPDDGSNGARVPATPSDEPDKSDLSVGGFRPGLDPAQPRPLRPGVARPGLGP